MDGPMLTQEEFLHQQLLCAQAARDRIRTPDRWTQRRMSRNYHGGRPDQYCAVGAIYDYGAGISAFFDNTDAPQRALIHRLFKKLPPGNYLTLTEWNDDFARTHDEVLALFDEVTTELKEEIRMEMPNVAALARSL